MKITRIVIHCSDTPNGRETTAADIHRWHLERGWDGIGYHRVIKLNGDIEHGRPYYWMGSHVRGYNENSIGICLIGNDEFTNAQWRSLEGLVLSLKSEHPDAKVLAHHDLDSHKTCPNFDVKSWWNGVMSKNLD